MYHFLILLLSAKLAYSLTCQEVLELPENRKLSIYELQTMQPSEIVDCISHLGRAEMAADEAEFVWNTIVEFFDGVENIPEEVLMGLHYVTVAVQPSDISNITLGNIDVISNFGSNYGLSDDQLRAIAGRVREDFAAKQPEDYTFYDLAALRRILCAFNNSEIERIRPKAYKEAASIIGKLKNCNREAMKAFAHLAVQKDAFGSPYTWTEATALAIGAVVEYLPEEILSKLKIKRGLNVSINGNM